MSVSTKYASPFESERLIGSVSAVFPDNVKINLPNAGQPSGQWLHGSRHGTGQVGDFVVIQTGAIGLFGRITDVQLPERDRIKTEPSLTYPDNIHPVGSVRLLATIEPDKCSPGVQEYPRLADRVYSAPGNLVKWIVTESANKDHEDTAVRLHLGSVSRYPDVEVHITPERLFGRHCAVLGTTGGGKSFTLTRLIEQSSQFGPKIILMDATGEYKDCFLNGVQLKPKGYPDERVASLPCSEFDESDIISFIAPAGKTQGPKLRDAIESLRIVKLAEREPSVATRLAPHLRNRRKILNKAGNSRTVFTDIQLEFRNIITKPDCPFDISSLHYQIEAECIWPAPKGYNADPSMFGGADETSLSYCLQMLTRVKRFLTSGENKVFFPENNEESIFSVIENFLGNANEKVLRIGLDDLPSDFEIREIVVNLMGRKLLKWSREGKFKAKPLLICLDEAHNYLSKDVGSDDFKIRLDAFDKIAKEGRKYWCCLCLATQRPRDLPDGVLSQMGTIIVHRLINDKDREVVERASGDIDRSAAAFLPTLGPGEAAIIGVDFPIPLTIQMDRPVNEPNSKGPDFQEYWKPIAF